MQGATAGPVLQVLLVSLRYRLTTSLDLKLKARTPQHTTPHPGPARLCCPAPLNTLCPPSLRPTLALAGCLTRDPYVIAANEPGLLLGLFMTFVCYGFSNTGLRDQMVGSLLPLLLSRMHLLAPMLPPHACLPGCRLDRASAVSLRSLCRSTCGRCASTSLPCRWARCSASVASSPQHASTSRWAWNSTQTRSSSRESASGGTEGWEGSRATRGIHYLGRRGAV